MNRSTYVLLSLVAVIVAGGLLAFILWNGNSDGDEVDTESGSSVVDILTAPEEFFNHDVRVEGEVGEVLAPSVFTIAGAESTELLVAASPGTLPGELGEDARIVVEGTVQQFSEDQPLVTEGGEELGISPYEQAFERYEGDPVLIASSVSLAGEGGGEGEVEDPAEETTLADIVADPESFRDRPVTVLAKIENQVAPGAWAIGTDEAATSVLVLVPETNAPDDLTEGALVRVAGTVTPFEPEREYEVGGEPLDVAGYESDALNDWGGDPAILADSFQLIAPALGGMIGNILDSPDESLGEQVEVTGRVADVGGGQAFALDGPDEETLLVAATPGVVPQGLAADAIVQVTGTVREFSTDDPESWGGAIFNEENSPSPDQFLQDNDEEFLDDHDGEPVVVANSIETLASASTARIDDILNDTGSFVGEEVTVAGKVEEDLVRQGFTLTGTETLFGLTEENLLVIGPSDVLEEAVVTEGVIVVVSGTVQEFSGDIADEYIGEVLENEDILRDFNEEPAIVADSIAVIAVE